MGNSTDKDKECHDEDSTNQNTPNSLRKQSRTGGQRMPSTKLNWSQKELIRQAWETSKMDVSARIYSRVFDKRPDLKTTFDTMGPYAWIDEAKKFTEFMDVVVTQLSDLGEIERLSLELGRRHAQWRAHGFKSEFWVVFAEAMTTECLYLDAGVHPAPDVLGAWATLITAIFGWVRDGYYESLRMQRRLSRKSSKPTGLESSSSSRSYSGSRTSSVDDTTIIDPTQPMCVDSNPNNNTKVTWMDQTNLMNIGQVVSSTE